MTDPIADLITRIRNGYLARKKTVEAPYSRVKDQLCRILKKERFIQDVKIAGRKPAEKKLVLTLAYSGKEPLLEEIRRISRPGLRVYANAGKIPLVRLGYGISIISTPEGLMTDQTAKKKNLGGEVICQVW